MDLKGLGYLISSISVLILGIVARPGPSEPTWHAVAVLLGMVLSILGRGSALHVAPAGSQGYPPRGP